MVVSSTPFCVPARQNLVFRAPSMVVFSQQCTKWYHKLYVLLRSLVRFLFVWLFDYLLAWMSGMMVTEISNAVKMMSLTRSQIMESSWRFNFMQKITGIA